MNSQCVESVRPLHDPDGKFCETHGESRTPEYATWGNMLYRCQTETAPQFHLYGGRGVRVCERWAMSFENFLEDMGPRPLGASIERIDVDGDYEPSNCRWATPIEQANNRRNTVRINGVTIRDTAQATGLTINTVKKRLSRGWTVERILSQTVRNYPKRPQC